MGFLAAPAPKPRQSSLKRHRNQNGLCKLQLFAQAVKVQSHETRPQQGRRRPDSYAARSKGMGSSCDPQWGTSNWYVQ